MTMGPGCCRLTCKPVSGGSTNSASSSRAPRLRACLPSSSPFTRNGSSRCSSEDRIVRHDAFENWSRADRFLEKGLRALSFAEELSQRDLFRNKVTLDVGAEARGGQLLFGENRVRPGEVTGARADCGCDEAPVKRRIGVTSRRRSGRWIHRIKARYKAPRPRRVRARSFIVLHDRELTLTKAPILGICALPSRAPA